VTEALDWAHKSVDVPAAGLERKRVATDAERAELAAKLGLIALPRLEVSYRIVGLAGGGYRLTGDVGANVEQACVVTLEPVPGTVDADFDVEFWPEVRSSDNDEDSNILEGPDVEVLDQGVIPVGRIAFETLSASLDPYPRREDAAFDWQDSKAATPEKSGPFAALSKLKDNKD